MSESQRALDALVRRLRPQRAEAKPLTSATNGHPKMANLSSVPDEAIIEKCRGEKRAPKFRDLFDYGDVDSHHGGDDSRADLALLDILRFWTQDEAQLERLFSASALGQRGKWRSRSDYRRRTIARALQGNFETYDWSRERSRPLVSSLSLSLGCTCDDDTREGHDEAEIVWFAKLGEPKEREYLIEGIGVKGYPIVAFGAGGVAKSFAMLAGGIAIAPGPQRGECIRHCQCTPGTNGCCPEEGSTCMELVGGGTVCSTSVTCNILATGQPISNCNDCPPGSLCAKDLAGGSFFDCPNTSVICVLTVCPEPG